MAKRRSQKVAETTDTFQRLSKALSKHTKRDLLALLVELAQADHGVLRQLDARFELNTLPHELVAATRRAIAEATAFDERYANYNFHYDHAAYEELKRNLTRLIKLKQLRSAMELALELMAKGSQQVEMSDEGLMTEEIEECLLVLVKALAKCDVPSDEKLAWCVEMTKRDRVGFICDDEIQTLRNRVKAARP